MLYWLTDQLVFPPVEGAEEWGGLALGGDLSPERLLLSYRSGIFPWYEAGQPIIWHAPDPRFVLFPDRLRVSRSMRPILNQQRFRVTFDQAFRTVVERCQQTPRVGQDGTWITDEMLEAYCRLHQLGHAHSVEVWQKETLVGGLYGIALGTIFCGESMFSNVSNASKVGFITLMQCLRNFTLIDCQVHTPHLERLGAEHISRPRYMHLLAAGQQRPAAWQALDI